ncbi:hypothetical protein Pst134EA_024443 [Puccinia striiformis f. sp. tritici]|uniref:hypothetical protein n=1 Tax=Puccinia striiformis f. sp. tritici TaxID=168172 RepID=UPI002007387B|nr:hypothetical protein Pst134EA_024443 [Puccinia striiformis f. sp. tritici]KAH9453575.1 hypothetical protein Pst134EA_024443 [Puccinia striiformis f. sp. tritici]
MPPKNSKRASAIAPNPRAVQNGEVLQRLNFLHQASHYLASVTRTDLDRTQLSKNEENSDHLHHHLPSNQPRSRHDTCLPIPHLPVLGLSRVLSKSMKVIAKKSVLRMDPSVKRSICRSCHLLLIPGTTSTTKILRSSSHRHKVKTRCLSCSHERQIPHPPKPKQDPTDRSGGHEHELMSEKKEINPVLESTSTSHFCWPNFNGRRFIVIDSQCTIPSMPILPRFSITHLPWLKIGPCLS